LARFKIEGGADDRIGDQVRQVAGDRQDLVVVPRIHHLDEGAGGLPQGPQFVQRPRVSRRWRRKNRVTILEKIREARIRAAMFGAGDRVAGNKVNPLRDPGTNIPDDRKLDRADIAYDRTWRETRR